jgi:hypothetical protein
MNRKAWLLVALMGAYATNVLADDDGSYVNYESIVNELKASAEQDAAPMPAMNWDEVAIHGGLGLTGSYASFGSPSLGRDVTGFLKGFEVHAGVNLFTRDARAEAVFRNFGNESVNNSVRTGLHEFELRLVFLPMLKEGWLMRMGTGLSERYLNVSSRVNGAWREDSSSTPFYSILLGFEHRIAKEVSIGPDFAHRASLDSGSMDKSSWDASFRLNATF